MFVEQFIQQPYKIEYLDRTVEDQINRGNTVFL